MSTRARVPSDPPAPLFVRARVFARARTARRVHDVLEILACTTYSNSPKRS